MKNDHPPYRMKRLYAGARSLSNQAKDALYRQGLEHLPDGTLHYSRVYDGPLSMLDQTTRKLSTTFKPLATLERQNDGYCEVRLSDLGREILLLLRAPWDEVHERFQNYKVMPQLKLLLRFRRWLPLTLIGHHSGRIRIEVATIVVEAIERVANSVRKRLRSPAMKRAIDNFSRSARDNYKSLVNGVEWLADTNPNVVSLRIDLHWEEKPAESFLPYSKSDLDLLDDFMTAREKFQALLNVKFGNRLLAAAWCLEHGVKTRFHVHYWILLVPDGHTHGKTVVEELGEQWKEMGGKGRGFYNCHVREAEYRHRAIGEVSLHDPMVRKGIQRLATYFTAAGLYVKLDLDNRFRAFGMPGFPRKPKSRPGPKGKWASSTRRLRLHEARDMYANWI